MFTRPKDKTILYFSGSPTVALARLLLESTPGVQSTIVYIETITVSFFQNLHFLQSPKMQMLFKWRTKAHACSGLSGKMTPPAWYSRYFFGGNTDQHNPHYSTAMTSKADYCVHHQTMSCLLFVLFIPPVVYIFNPVKSDIWQNVCFFTK